MIMNETKQPKPKRHIDYGKIYGDLKKNKRLFLIVLPIAFALAVFFTLSIPSYYICKVELSPELTNRTSSGVSLASLASSFGVKLGTGLGNSSRAEAIFPNLYPDLMSSVDFKTALFKIKVKREDGEEFTYYDYLREGQSRPWWSSVIGAITSLFPSDEDKPGNGKKDINPRRLTKKQTRIAKTLNSKVKCEVDKKSMVIYITVKDNDPEVCTTVVDSTMALLQRFITDYRTKKARIDLEHYKKLTEEARISYEQANRAYARYVDANLHSFQAQVRQKQAELETEAQLQRGVYQQVVGQLKQAEMKVQEETPAFAVIQASTVPVKRAGPPRKKMCLLALFLAFLATSVYAIHKEGDLKMFIG